ncbi:PREDICTED: B3 domain-containing protein Os03g0212300-like [Nelumbo nucifera]|uniref:B3 domain-containing protein Os03g0212300-like n=1 Tax=Nelumbo nucifera TaxID=4432 RepID=A0A1U8PY73_NELNU|nr:PREDICTED: B3 domain-containing protein Os03g0212300-like [Nelumbo nucifera]
MPSGNPQNLKMLKLAPPHKRCFYTVFSPSSSIKLEIPPAFNRHLAGESWIDEARLNSCKGSWDVKVRGSGRSSEDMYFEKGWEDFVKEHKLHVGDLLVFQHHGRLVFDVMIFDPSACQKEYHPAFIGEERKQEETMKRQEEIIHPNHSNSNGTSL